MTTRSGTVAFVGRPNVGKSTLLNALLGERIAITSPHPETTRDRISGILTVSDVQYVLVDTPGVHRPRHELGKRMNEVTAASANDADVVVFVTDVSTDRTGEITTKRSSEDRTVLATVPPNKPTVLVLNKVDRVPKKDALFPLLADYATLRDFVAVIPLSARQRDAGLEHLLRELKRHLPKGDFLFEEGELSDRPVRFFAGEFVREQILKATRDEIPHGVAVTVDAFNESKDIVRISVTIHVAKDSHKAILIGQKGAMLKAIGTAARKRTEELLGTKVHLETRVRATPKWFDVPARLAEMGYAGADLPKRKPQRKKAK